MIQLEAAEESWPLSCHCVNVFCLLFVVFALHENDKSCIKPQTCVYTNVLSLYAFSAVRLSWKVTTRERTSHHFETMEKRCSLFPSFWCSFSHSHCLQLSLSRLSRDPRAHADKLHIPTKDMVASAGAGKKISDKQFIAL